MSKRKKIEKTDGLGPLEIKKIRNAVRQVWHRCHARKLVVDRCTRASGYAYCEKCSKRCPKLKIDHIENVGDVNQGFIQRMFVPSKELQGLCDKCHKVKTKDERARMKALKAEK